MEEYFKTEDNKIRLFNGDSLDVLKEFPDNSISSIVCDPPYGLGKEPDATKLLKAWLENGHYELKGKGFMGQTWDSFVPQPDLWKECLRVLKPGGYLLSFSGTRTIDLVGLGLRLAGFEIRDNIGYAHETSNDSPLLAWVYGSGYPKGINIDKAIDKKLKQERDIVGYRKERGTAIFEGGQNTDVPDPITVPKSDLAKEWKDFNSTLKPAFEPVIMARKPFKGLLVDNVLEHGTGALNIGACRIEYQDPSDVVKVSFGGAKGGINGKYGNSGNYFTNASDKGRFPSNIIHDGSEEVLDLFPNTKGGSGNGNAEIGEEGKTIPLRRGKLVSRNDKGNAARFFYCAKASTKDRDEGLDSFENVQTLFAEGTGLKEERDLTPHVKNFHTTVKPTDVMRWLVRLVTPKGGVVLDPFLGSGSTGKACICEGFNFVGIEKEEKYMELAKARIMFAYEKVYGTETKEEFKEEKNKEEQMVFDFDKDVINSELKKQE